MTRLPCSGLAIIELFRALDPGMSMRTAALFLAVCENEGVTSSALCQMLGESSWNVSRSLAVLECASGSASNSRSSNRLDLVIRDPGIADARVKAVRLTERGRRLRDLVNAEIAAARPTDHAARAAGTAISAA